MLLILQAPCEGFAISLPPAAAPGSTASRMTKSARKNAKRRQRSSARRQDDVPPALRQMCMAFHRDLHLVVAPDHDLVKYALDRVGPEEGPAANAYLDRLLDGRFSPSQIFEWWLGSGAEYYVLGPADIVRLLTAIRDRLVVRPVRANPGRGNYRHRR